MAEYKIGQRYRGSGITMPGICGETIPRGAAVYMSAVDGLWYLADSDAMATLPAAGLASDGGATGNNIEIILIGIIGRSDWTWTRGDTLYVSGTPGVMTHVAPGNAQPVALALTATLVYVNPTLAGAERGYSATALVTIPATTDPPQINWNHAQNTLVAAFHPQTEPASFEWLEVVDADNILIHMANVDFLRDHTYRVFVY